MRTLASRRRVGADRRIDWVFFLEGKLNVEERCHGLDRNRVLCMVQEIPNARLKLDMPFKNIELGIRKRLVRFEVSACFVQAKALEDRGGHSK